MPSVARSVQGVGAAVIFAVSLAALSHAFPRVEERMKALAAYAATMGGSFAIGPLFRQAGTAVGVAAFGALVRAGAALGGERRSPTSTASTTRWAPAPRGGGRGRLEAA